MSADNIMIIYWSKSKKVYRGYDCSASCDTNINVEKDNPTFEAKTMTHAVKKALDHYTEYGFRFANYSPKDSKEIAELDKIESVT